MKPEQIREPDYGFTAPIKTRPRCANPGFHNPQLHRVGIYRDEHWGHTGDRDPGGLPGWATLKICVNCGRVIGRGGFYPDGGAAA